MNTKICSVCNAENYEDNKCCVSCGAVFLDHSDRKTPSGHKKNIIIAAAAIVLVAAVAVGAMFIFGGDKPPVASGGDIVFEDNETTETTRENTTTTEKKETEPSIVFTSENVTNATVTFHQATSHKPTTATTTTATTTAPTTTSRVYTTTATTTTEAPSTTAATQPSTQVIAPGIFEPEKGVIQVSDDLRYSLNLFINNFVEADMESFEGFPDENELFAFAMNFNLINKSENFEVYNPPVEINGQMYNRRIKREYIVESIEDYLLVKVDSDFGEGKDCYSDGYFYVLHSGGMLYNKIGIVTRVEYLGDDLYSVDFNLYNNTSGNDGMYRYSDSQMKSAADASDGNIFFLGTGNAIIDAANINNYGTYYLDSYNID